MLHTRFSRFWAGLFLTAQLVGCGPTNSATVASNDGTTEAGSEKGRPGSRQSPESAAELMDGGGPEDAAALGSEKGGEVAPDGGQDVSVDAPDASVGRDDELPIPSPSNQMVPMPQPDISVIETTSMNGVVYDEDGIPVDGATVSASSLNSSVAYEAETTTQAGTYTLTGAPAGVQMRLTVAKEELIWRPRVEVLKSNKQGDPTANKYDFHAYAISSLEVAVDHTSRKVGETAQLTATVHYSDGVEALAKTASWSSDAEDVATVETTTGLVNAVAPGEVTFTATFTEGPHTASASLELTVSPETLTYAFPSASYRLGTPITPNAPAFSGSGVEAYSVEPALPTGLALDVSTGVISGTPTALSEAVTYTVTARRLDVDTSTTIAIDINCQDGFVRVPKDPGGVYTNSDFCLAKYIASEASGYAASVPGAVPWTNIDFEGARAACAGMGVGYDLVTNNEWQTVARNVELVASNWSLGRVPVGAGDEAAALNRGVIEGNVAGHEPVAASSDDSASCYGTESTCDLDTWSIDRRTFMLDTGDVVWDLAGNVWQWVYNEDVPVMSYSFANYIITLSPSSSPEANAAFGPAGDYSFLTFESPYGGLGYGELFFTPGEGIFRGGSLYSGVPYQGIFAVRSDKELSYTNSIYGFRCAYHPSSN